MQIINIFKNNYKYILAIVASGLFLFIPFLFSDKLLFASDQVSAPAWNYFFNALKSGQFPLWNYLRFGGFPTYDASCGDCAYPVFLFMGLIFDTQRLIGYSFVLHVLIAGFCSYILFRRYFRLSKLFCLFLAMAYMLNTNYISHIYAGHSGKFYILSWLPLGIFFLLRTLQKDSKWYHLLGLSLCLQMFLLTVHLQFTYYVLMGFFVIWVSTITPLIRQKKFKSLALNTGKFWTPILLGLGVIYVILTPPMKYNELYSVRGEGSKTSFEHATSWSSHPEEIFSLLTVPQFAGINQNYWGRNAFKLNSEYPGITVVFLGLLGLMLFRSRWHYVWGIIGALAILFSLGAHTPFFSLIFHTIPGMKYFRAPSMMLFWLATSLIMMSATTLIYLFSKQGAVQGLSEKKKDLTFKISLGIGGLLILFGIFPDMLYGIWNSVFSTAEISNFKKQSMALADFRLGAFINGGIIIAIAFSLKHWALKASKEKNLALVLIATTLLDLFIVDSNFVSTHKFEQYFPSEPAIENIKRDDSRFRVFALTQRDLGGYLQYHNISSISGFIDHEYNRYRKFKGEPHYQNPNFLKGLLNQPDGTVGGSKFLDLLNVKYILFQAPNSPSLQIALNKTFMPREFMRYEWEFMPDSQLVEGMLSETFNPRTTVLLPNYQKSLLPKPSGLSALPSSKTEKIKNIKYSNNEIVYEVENSEPGIFVASEVNFPHWHVEINGEHKDMLMANFILRGAYLEKGKHNIRFYYSSPWINKGWIFSILSLVLLIAVVFVYRMFYPKLKNVQD